MTTHLIASDTSYQMRSHEISIALGCFFAKDYFPINSDYRTKIALVKQARGLRFISRDTSYRWGQVNLLRKLAPGNFNASEFFGSPSD